VEQDETAGRCACFAVARACGKLLRQAASLGIIIAAGSDNRQVTRAAAHSARARCYYRRAVRAVGWKRRGRRRAMGRQGDPTRIQRIFLKKGLKKF
jgi:hypothetical protein